MRHVNRFLSVVGGAAIMMAGSTAMAAPWYTDSYEADAVPESSTPAWTKYYGGNYSATDGILTVTTPGLGADPSFLEFHQDGGTGLPWDPTGDGITVEARLKVISNNDSGWAGGMTIATGSQAWTIYIGGDLLTVVGGGKLDLHTATKDDFHIFRFTTDEDSGILSLYVDNNATALETWTSSSTSSSYLAFGVTNAVQTPGQIEWDYIRWTNEGAIAPVPEPAGLCLLLLGGLPLMRRRRA